MDRKCGIGSSASERREIDLATPNRRAHLVEALAKASYLPNERSDGFRDRIRRAERLLSQRISDIGHLRTEAPPDL